MSEYQHYGFQAIDRPLSQDDREWLRSLSTRAEITSTSFVNEYHWGGFRGDPIKMMGRCFDVFVYFANWGSRRFIMRLPRGSFDLDKARQYCVGDCVSLLEKKDCILLDFSRNDETGDWEGWANDSEWMAAIVPLRANLLDDDWRCLYPGWLTGIEEDTLCEEDREPPLPPGMKSLSAPLRAFADFMGIDSELIETSAEPSEERKTNKPSAQDLNKWIRSLASSEKDELLQRVAQGDELDPRRFLLRQFKQTVQGRNTARGDKDSRERRTVAQISETWRQQVEAKRLRLEQEAEQERERRAREKAQARKKHLEDTARRSEAIWREVLTWTAKRSPKGYDRAIELLSDLKDAAAMTNRRDEFTCRLRELQQSHSSKPSLILRIAQAGLAR